MNNRKLGGTFLVIGIILSIFIFNLSNEFNKEAEDMGCFEGDNCVAVQSGLSITHFAFGFIGFIAALGFYLIFFSKGEEEILKRLEENKRELIKEERFDLVLKGLDPYEKKVLQTIKEQDGITQNTLRIRAEMSKAKLSYVIKDLEKRDLIKKIQKGKTFSIFLKEIV